jgi:predicted site-specific integrase-resolvase
MRSRAEHRGDALRQLEQEGRCTVPNAAVLMGIHHHTLRAYIEDGSVQGFLIGKRWWVTQEEMQRYKSEGKRTSNLATT